MARHDLSLQTGSSPEWADLEALISQINSASGLRCRFNPPGGRGRSCLLTKAEIGYNSLVILGSLNNIPGEKYRVLKIPLKGLLGNNLASIQKTSADGYILQWRIDGGAMGNLMTFPRAADATAHAATMRRRSGGNIL